MAILIGLLTALAAQLTDELLLPNRPQFVLHDPDGNRVTATNHRTELLLIHFVSNAHQERRANTLSQLAQVMKALGTDADHVQVACIVTDPNPDALQDLRVHLAKLDRHFMALTGSSAALAEAAESFGVSQAGVAANGAPNRVQVIDRHGTLVSTVDPQQSTAEIAADLRQHLISLGRGSCCHAQPKTTGRLRLMNQADTSSTPASPSPSSVTPSTPSEKP